MNQLQGRVCIVTGAARGLGAAIVRAFVAEGASVIATDIDGGAVAEVYSDLPPNQVVTCAHDVTDEGQWDRIVNLASGLGGLDVLVNNAGMYLRVAIEAMSLEQWRAISRVNLDGTFLGTRHCLQLTKDTTRRRTSTGSIINMSSIGGLRGTPMLSAYCMTKGGIRLFTKAAAAQLGEYNIRVNSIHPGVIETEMGMASLRDKLKSDGRDGGDVLAVGSMNPMGRIGHPSDIATAAVYLASDVSSFMTGAEIVVDGGLTAR